MGRRRKPGITPKCLGKEGWTLGKENTDISSPRTGGRRWCLKHGNNGRAKGIRSCREPHWEMNSCKFMSR